MELTIRHFIPGRVRLHIPALCRRRALAEAAQAWLRARAEIKSARINYDCACLIVEYDMAHEDLLRAMIGRLRLMSLPELRQLVAFAGEHDQRPAELAAGRLDGTQSPLRRAPLALPTLSLALAFSSNPIVIAINMPLMVWNVLPIALRAWRVWRRERRLNVDFLDTLAVAASLAQGHPLAGSRRNVADQAGRLDPRSDRCRLAACHRRVAGVPVQDRVGRARRQGRLDPARRNWPSATCSGDLPRRNHSHRRGNHRGARATIDQKTITGESLPIIRGKGEAAFAATVLRDGQLTVRALRVGAQTTAGQIAHLVESAPIGDTRMQNHAERLADRLVVPTLAARRQARWRCHARLQPLPLAGHRRLRHGHSGRRADLGAGLDGAFRPSRHHHQERRSTWSAWRHLRHSGIRQDGDADLRQSGRHRRASPTTPTSRQHHLLGLAAAAETRLRHPVAEASAQQGASNSASTSRPATRRNIHVGLGVEGQVNGYYLHVGNERLMRQSDISIERGRRRPCRAR